MEKCTGYSNAISRSCNVPFTIRNQTGTQQQAFRLCGYICDRQDSWLRREKLHGWPSAACLSVAKHVNPHLPPPTTSVADYENLLQEHITITEMQCGNDINFNVVKLLNRWKIDFVRHGIREKLQFLPNFTINLPFACCSCCCNRRTDI